MNGMGCSFTFCTDTYPSFRPIHHVKPIVGVGRVEGSSCALASDEKLGMTAPHGLHVGLWLLWLQFIPDLRVLVKQDL